MAKPGTWKKGQSGNPNGRPLKNRTLTEILKRTGCKTVLDTDGKRRSGKRVLARLVWEIALQGEATLPSGNQLKASPNDWIGIVKWIYAQIDGPPRSELDVTSDGEPVKVTMIEVIRNQDVE